MHVVPKRLPSLVESRFLAVDKWFLHLLAPARMITSDFARIPTAFVTRGVHCISIGENLKAHISSSFASAPTEPILAPELIPLTSAWCVDFRKSSSSAAASAFPVWYNPSAFCFCSSSKSHSLVDSGLPASPFCMKCNVLFPRSLHLPFSE